MSELTFGATNISVAIRVRPMAGSTDDSSQSHSPTITAMEPWQVTPTSLTQVIFDSEERVVMSGAQFTFDRVFGQNVRDNGAIFDQVAKDIIDSTLDGINGKR